jgi:hypothetical protein
MNYEPIIKNKLSFFKKSYGLESQSDHAAFELFVNNLILRTYLPESFSAINDLFDSICVGGNNDTGIDGIAIKVNGIFIATKQDIDNIIKTQNKINIEFLFIQSKFKENLDSGEFGKFADGIVDFLNDKSYEPHNEKIEYWMELKKYLFAENVLIYWNASPNVKIYYAYMGTWKGNEHIEAKAQRIKSDIASFGLFDEVEVKYIDCAQLKRICDDIENNYSEIITVIDSFELNEVPQVESSRILFCDAEDFIKLLLNEEGNLRKSLFKDNVRDYQGNTEINNEIYKTMQNTPDNFCLLNNGVTIVCKSMIPGNRKMSITSPQIVNGCQTCSVLYSAYKNGVDISKITLIVKLIATKDENITNSVVKGTNRQNVVYDEVFEITRDFHKNLEDHLNAIQSNCVEEKIYYERRSKQYLDNVNIKATQKVNFKSLIQSFVSIMLHSPHDGIIHESNLLDKYRDKIFIDGQSFYPYYIAPLMFLKADELFRNNRELYKDIITYKFQLLCLTAEMSAGIVPDINNSKEIDKYCERLLTIVRDKVKYTEAISISITEFLFIKDKWIKAKGIQYKYSIKDNQEFTTFMLITLRGGDPNKIIEENSESFRGTVATVKKDRNNFYYGFIKKYPCDVFIHEDDNPKIHFDDLAGKDVVYTLTGSSQYNTPRGKIKYVITHDNAD